jgi:hypothetical protein
MITLALQMLAFADFISVDASSRASLAATIT